MTRRELMARDERGVVLPLVALFLVVIVAAASLGIDVGNIVQNNRQLQKLADLAALDAARVLDGSDNATIFPAVCQAALASVQGRNGFTAGPSCNAGSLVVVTGTWDPATRTFQPAALPTDVPNAVDVTTTEDIRYFFSAGSQTDSRSAIATDLPTAGVEIGTFVTAVGSPLFCAVADALAPGPCATSSNYAGLAAAHVNVDDLAAAGGYRSADALLGSTIGFSDLKNLVAAADPGDAPTVSQMTAGPQQFELGTLLAGFAGSTAAAAAQLDVLDLLLSGAQLADGGAAISISNLGIPGASATVAAIQAPAFAWGPVGTTATTGQVQVTMQMVGASIQVTGNSGTATLTQVTCANPASVQLVASTSIVNAQVLGVPAVTIPGAPPTTLTFTPPAPAQTIGPTTDLGQQLGLPQPVGQIVDQLMQALGVEVGGATVNSPGVTPPAALCPGPLPVR